MEILPLHTPTLSAGDSLADALQSAGNICDDDIIIVSSKAVATVEGAAIALSTIEASDEAHSYADLCGGDPRFRQVVLDETQRMHGSVSVSSLDVMLTELVPDGLTEGSLLVPNAGVDQSNITEGSVIGWPLDPMQSAQHLRDGIDANVAVIISDSGCRPRRLGVTAFALTACGIDPIVSLQGIPDIFGRDLRISQEALADQLATAGNMIMGNCNQSTPAAIIRHHGVRFSDFCGWVPGIEKERDMFFENNSDI